MTTDAVSNDENVSLLWRRWREVRDKAARDALIAHHLSYARILAATLYGRRTHDEIEFDDYLQWASIGLIESVERFDPDQGVQFKTFASKRVQGAVLNGLAGMTEKGQQIAVIARLRRDRLQAIKSEVDGRAGGSGQARDPADLFNYLAEVGVGVALGVLLEGTGMFAASDDSPSPTAGSPEVSYFRKSELQTLQQLLHHRLQRLPEGERRVIQWHYQQEMSFDDIAQRLGLTRGRISQLHRKGLATLRELLHDGSTRDVIA